MRPNRFDSHLSSAFIATALAIAAGCTSESAPGGTTSSEAGADASGFCVGQTCGTTCCPGNMSATFCANNAGWMCDGHGACVLPDSSTECGTADASGADANPATLQWWNTCGDPVCRAPSDGGADAGLTDDAGLPCPAVGTACSTAGDMCGTSNPGLNCGATEICSATDPTHSTAGCPLSSRKFKDNIRYVDDGQLEQLHEEALHIRLATYNYKAQFEDPTARHLGFIVEDDPNSPAVDRPYDRVDLYGYLSMTLATIQVQEKEISDLRHELDSMRAGICTQPHVPAVNW